MEVEQMGLYRKRFRAKGRAVANVSYGIKTFLSYSSPSDIDAILGRKFLVTA